MNVKLDVKAKMKIGGHRKSKTREAIVEILQSCKEPLSVPDILETLKESGIIVNKTTIYREIEKLAYHDIVNPVNLDDEVTRYELTDLNHHHHLVCVSCRSIQDVTLARDLSAEEKRISSQSNFKVMRHSLEFFGLCNRCQY